MRTTTGKAWLALLSALLPITALGSCEERTACQELLLAREERCERCGGCEDWDLPNEEDVECPEFYVELAECLIPCHDAPCTGDEYDECFYKCNSAAVEAED